jgi:hypothetical protein
MLVQSTRPRRALLAPEALPEPKVAVLLNFNAKRVTAKVVQRVGHVVPAEDVFVSKTFADADRIAKQVVAGNYTTVFTGGGDGTFVAFYNAIQRELEAQGHGRMPRFGILKLGTGNSLANLVGASSTSGDGILDDILRARANEVPSVRRLDLVRAEGRVAPFVGMGYDAALLNDYNTLKNTAPVGKAFLATQAGYLLALAGKTLPHYMLNPRPVQGEIVCQGRGMKLDADGKVTHVFNTGDVLYRGGLNIVAAGTVPCYGFNFKMFPFAGKRRGMMQLRASSIAGLTAVANLPSLWKGTWRHPGIHDFLVEGATARFEREMPLQIGGDAEGYRKELTLGLSERSVELVDFTSTLN